MLIDGCQLEPRLQQSMQLHAALGMPWLSQLQQVGRRELLRTLAIIVAAGHLMFAACRGIPYRRPPKHF